MRGYVRWLPFLEFGQIEHTAEITFGAHESGMAHRL
ncbi:MAG: hypothetical protein JWM56_137 [Candidatus Peribacteria bacterium]|nr:hypothetical protein [Candidatus Peribacteria bacterium]